MSTKQTNTKTTAPVRAGLPEGTDWSPAQRAEIEAYLKQEAARRSPEQRRKNALMAVLYKMEDYLEQDTRSIRNPPSIDNYLKELLEVLNLTFKHFAQSIDTTDANLKKYVSGERKFNAELALKFGSFFHMSPDMWLRLQHKNELVALTKEEKLKRDYKKYNYENVLTR